MNFLDPYDITGTTTPPQGVPEQSLDEEVSQVIGQFGRFWGNFRKQSQTAFEIARKDFSDVVVQAQREFSKLTEPPKPTTTEDNANSTTSADCNSLSSASTPTNTEPSPSSSDSTSMQSLLSRLQSALPPNIVSTVQNNIPETLRHASENVDFAQLRATLSSEFQRVQGVTRAQAEEYVRKSEGLLREAMKEAGEVLKDAVKIIPPEESDSTVASSSALFWDGTDMWMLPSESSDSSLSSSTKGKDKDIGIWQSSEVQRVVTRAEALLRRLKHDPDIIRTSPDTEQLAQWVTVEVESKEGGIDNDAWTIKIASALQDITTGAALKATLDELVPAEMDHATFWTRYFFRVHQIEQEEAKRRALLEATTENEEEFSWEDDEDEPTSPIKAGTVATTNSAPAPSAQPSHQGESTMPQARTPGNTSPHESSEDSYDMVSSGNASNNGDQKKPDADDGDSDWE